MSSLTIIDSVPILFRNFLAAWVAASQPPGTPTPSCFGIRSGVTRGMANALAHLDASRRHTYPMAIGLSPPQLLRRAKSVPPNKIERSSWGQVPASSRLMTAVVVFSSPGPESGSAISSGMCWGRSPSGPPAKPMGKERIIELIIDSAVWKAVLDVERRMAGRSDDGAGCFCRRSCSVSSFIGAGLLSELLLLLLLLRTFLMCVKSLKALFDTAVRFSELANFLYYFGSV